jgi:GGDEF domain-containing protein
VEPAQAAERSSAASSATWRSRLNADELVRNADVAMYVSKHGGRGRLSHYDAQAA